MLLLVLLLVVTNLATLGVLLWSHLRPGEHPEPDAVVAAAVDAMRPPASSSSTRRVITVEILNPIELAGTRGRLAGIAGSVAPGITRRIVYDQALKNLRRQLVQEKVVADVRLHVITANRPDAKRPEATSGVDAQRSETRPVVDVVEVEPRAGTEDADRVD